MPSLDGFEATALIREHAALTAVVVLTGSYVSRRPGEGPHQRFGYVTKDRILVELVETILLSPRRPSYPGAVLDVLLPVIQVLLSAISRRPRAHALRA